MIDAISKIIPMITVAGGAAASSPNLKAQIAKLMDATKVVATQTEVSDIAKMVYLDTIDGTQPKPDQFGEYLRKNMLTTNRIKRDTARDQWGQQYRLLYDTRKREIVVTSAGPDKTYDTADDINGIFPLQNQVGL